MEDEYIEFEVSSILNTEILVYQGEESLQTGEYIVNIGSSDEKRLHEFSTEKALYLVTEFTSD